MTELIPELKAPVADPGTGCVRTGMAVARIDGRAKVTGAAQYAAEHGAPDLAHGVVVGSTIASGRIASLDARGALAAPGVIDVITYMNRPRLRSFDLFYKLSLIHI